MALIKCPECEKEISDKSKQCIHCGFPLPTVEKEVPDGFCLIDGVPRDLREALNKIDDYPNMTPDEQKKLKGWIFGQCQTISIYAAEQLLNIMLETHAVPKEFDGSYKRVGNGRINNIQPAIHENARNVAQLLLQLQQEDIPLCLALLEVKKS